MVCFVNTEDRPSKIEKLGIYRYSEKDGEKQFSELCRVSYLFEEQVNYQLLDWYPVLIKPWCQQPLANIIDIFKGVEEFKM